MPVTRAGEPSFELCQILSAGRPPTEEELIASDFHPLPHDDELPPLAIEAFDRPRDRRFQGNTLSVQWGVVLRFDSNHLTNGQAGGQDLSTVALDVG